jgi:hypothetical protein
MELVPETPKTPVLPEDDELTKLYQEYLQKCCEAGQIRFNLSQLESQQREMEKQLDTTERAVKSAAHKHKELQAKKFQKLKLKDEPKLELKEESKH